MAPAQCPDCGRFLSKAFVQALVTEPGACPKCGHVLSAAEFEEVVGQAGAPDGPVEEPAGAAALREDAMPDPDPGADPGSVRPPDLDPGTVRRDEDGERDPLQGWDPPGADVVDMDAFRAGRRPPPDGAIVAGAAIAGAVVGGLVARRRGAGAVLGLVSGAAAAATARQVWRLPD